MVKIQGGDLHSPLRILTTSDSPYPVVGNRVLVNEVTTNTKIPIIEHISDCNRQLGLFTVPNPSFSDFPYLNHANKNQLKHPLKAAFSKK